MRAILLTLLSLCLSGYLLGQVGFTKITQSPKIEQVFKKKMDETQTMVGQFTQIKTMRLLNEKMQSKGVFNYKKANKINITYTTPFQYEVRINNGHMLVKDQNKQQNRINTKNNNTLQSINQLMMDCMTGNIFNNKDFEISPFESKTEYLLTLEPNTASIKKLYKKIDVYFDKSTTNIKKLIITEVNGDVTQMQFSNLLFNQAVNEALFKVK